MVLIHLAILQPSIAMIGDKGCRKKNLLSLVDNPLPSPLSGLSTKKKNFLRLPLPPIMVMDGLCGGRVAELPDELKPWSF